MCNMERVYHFVYCWVTITSNNSKIKEIEKNNNKGSRAMVSLNRMLRSKEVLKARKFRLYRTAINNKTNGSIRIEE